MGVTGSRRLTPRFLTRQHAWSATYRRPVVRSKLATGRQAHPPVMVWVLEVPPSTYVRRYMVPTAPPGTLRARGGNSIPQQTTAAAVALARRNAEPSGYRAGLSNGSGAIMDHNVSDTVTSTRARRQQRILAHGA